MPMNEPHKYHLQPYQGLNTRHKCPRCGDVHSFTFYIDNEGNVLNEIVGRCNHESGCGYHYTPSQFFKDNPRAKERRDGWQNTKPSRLPYSIPAYTPPKQTNPINTIPFEYVEKSKCLNSDFVHFLSLLFGIEQIKDVAEQYGIGATRAGDVIYWQIDTENRVRTGKIMKYNPINGHRIKEGVGQVDWIHSRLKRLGNLPADWILSQCLFGEHLINKEGNKEKMVALVESEKSAIIGAMQFPEYLWLATGGINNFNAEKLKVLSGRKVVIFPDVDGMEKWRERAKGIGCCRFTISDVLEKNATQAEREAKIDIADWIIAERLKGNCTTQTKPQPAIQPAATTPPPPIWNENGMPEFYHQLTQCEVEQFEEIKERHPAFADFADVADLELMEVETFDSLEEQAERLVKGGGFTKANAFRFLKGEKMVFGDEMFRMMNWGKHHHEGKVIVNNKSKTINYV